MKLISIVIPAYNEEECVDELAARLQTVMATLDRYDFEVIVVENGSADATYEKLRLIQSNDPRFKIIQLSRNFNMEGGMLAGLAHVTGDACVVMAADLQDPPELIPEFVAKWEQGYENVYQIVTKRTDNPLWRRIGSAGFYWTLGKISTVPVPRSVSDFRLVDRRVYEAFNELPECDRMVRSTWAWLGFRAIGIEHERPPRHGGTSQFKPFATAAYAVRGILASSLTPLKVIPLLGIGLSGLSFLALISMVLRAVLHGVPFPGFGTLVCLMLMLFGMLFLMLGVLSEYIGMTYTEARHRPPFVVRAAHGFGEVSGDDAAERRSLPLHPPGTAATSASSRQPHGDTTRIAVRRPQVN